MIETVKQVNWVDLLALILLVRIIYISPKTGLPSEIFKLLGTISAIYLSLHYFLVFSDFMAVKLYLKFLPIDLLDFISFILLALCGYLAFFILREFFNRLIKMEPVAGVARWGSVCLGTLRGFLCAGLIISVLAVSGIAYIRNSINDSFSGSTMLKLATGVYSALWNGLVSKFATSEKINESVFNLSQKLQ